MARVESLKRKMTRLIIAIIVVSVGLVFLLQILLNVLEFSNFGKSLYTNFWKQPHYIFSFTSACISIMTPLLIIYVFTQFFYKVMFLINTIQKCCCNCIISILFSIFKCFSKTYWIAIINTSCFYFETSKKKCESAHFVHWSLNGK